MVSVPWSAAGPFQVIQGRACWTLVAHLEEQSQKEQLAGGPSPGCKEEVESLAGRRPWARSWSVDVEREEACCWHMEVKGEIVVHEVEEVSGTRVFPDHIDGQVEQGRKTGPLS